jgi:5-methyltetrahydrofolate--homocysteine methyltransferase
VLVAGLSLADFFNEQDDSVALMAVTLGPGLKSITREQLDEDRYADYFLLHGFAAELTEALAAYWHAQIRKEWGIAEKEKDPLRRFRGCRYAFGYPTCPDLSMNRACCDLLNANRIGISVNENFMMIPEVSTCALIAHHPQALYFNITTAEEQERG